ncbi:membrane protein [Verticillium alfalfae VaMs.102]|uniref:Membrane protein n=1 Tax=Verticillium alfalfae (strain VaMs.102 / ATCC MYA-4576 / FGSC 10136) TaxID=526221 RepID=C9S7H4_VERA1|nr:membrane protein [Verticillium alfalfae VaMs.102]EEY14735.1 membrane protein [Verticillium alfalfae VaMs.102]
MTHGREPVSHLWPMNHVLPRVDISDPHTFLAIKRGILQYAWLKPVLSVASIIMKATGTYQEGYIGLSSGYLWEWHRLQRQRDSESILTGVEGYTPDNLAAAIQDALICIEMPVFAVAHWYAFSWHDFADQNVLAARMPVKFAFRDAFGIRDLIEDTKQTFSGDQYNYRIYDSGDKIMPHEESRARLGRLKEGMRYQRGGKGKYWIPTPGQVDRQVNHDLNERDPLLSGTAGGPSEEYNFENGTFHDIDEENKDPEEEELYAKARELEYGDWNVDGNYRYQPSRPQGPRTYSQNSHQSSEPAVVSSRPKKQKQKQKQKRIPAPKLSGQGLIPDHSSPTAGPAATSSNVSTPRVQSPKTVHATAAESESVETVASSKTKDDKKKPAAAPQKQAASHESSPWANKDESEDEPDLRFRVGDEEEFRNVWDGGDQRDR